MNGIPLPERGSPVDLDDWLLRRGITKYLNPDGTATSRIFKLREKDAGALSVNVESMTTKELSIVDPSKYSLFRVSNRTVSELGLSAIHDPLPDGSNNAHAVILGMRFDDDTMPLQLARRSYLVAF
jgi:hypothetical protein